MYDLFNFRRCLLLYRPRLWISDFIFNCGASSTIFFSLKNIFFDSFNFVRNLNKPELRVQQYYDIILHVEGPQYWNSFTPILKELNTRSEKRFSVSVMGNNPLLTSPSMKIFLLKYFGRQ